MQTSNSAFSALLDIFIAPGAVFRATREHRQWFWLPLGLLVVASVAFWGWYYLSVDFDWLVASILSQGSQDLSAQQIEQASAFMSPTTMLISSLVGSVAFVFIVYALIALYLFMVFKVGGDEENSYGLWFGTSAWACFPAILVTIGMALSYGLAENTQVAPGQLSITDLNSVLFHLSMTHPWAAWLGSLDLTMFWTLALLGLAISQYSGRSYGKSLFIAAAPAIVIFGLWALFIII